MTYSMMIDPVSMWAKAVEPKKQEMVISPEYIKLNELHEECLMALTFSFIDPLVKKLFVMAAPGEHEDLYTLFNQENLYFEIDKNSNFIIHN